MRDARDPRLLQTEAADPKKTQSRSGPPPDAQEASPTEKPTSTLDAAPAQPLSAEQGIAMEDTSFLLPGSMDTEADFQAFQARMETG